MIIVTAMVADIIDKETSSTLELGWPVDIPYVLVNQRIHLSIKHSLDVLGIRKHVEARGFKKVENFLIEQGKILFSIT